MFILAKNKLPVQEIYPKMIQFLSDEMEEPVTRQYLQSSAKNATYESSGSCAFCFSFLHFFLLCFIFSFSRFLFEQHKRSVFCCSKWYCTLCRLSNICCKKGNDWCFYWLLWWNFEIFQPKFHLTGICIIYKLGILIE